MPRRMSGLWPTCVNEPGAGFAAAAVTADAGPVSLAPAVAGWAVMELNADGVMQPRSSPVQSFHRSADGAGVITDVPVAQSRGCAWADAGASANAPQNAAAAQTAWTLIRDMNSPLSPSAPSRGAP